MIIAADLKLKWLLPRRFCFPRQAGFKCGGGPDSKDWAGLPIAVAECLAHFMSQVLSHFMEFERQLLVDIDQRIEIYKYIFALWEREWLGNLDSNQDERSQSPSFYR